MLRSRPKAFALGRFDVVLLSQQRRLQAISVTVHGKPNA